MADNNKIRELAEKISEMDALELAEDGLCESVKPISVDTVESLIREAITPLIEAASDLMVNVGKPEPWDRLRSELKGWE